MSVPTDNRGKSAACVCHCFSAFLEMCCLPFFRAESLMAGNDDAKVIWYIDYALKDLSHVGLKYRIYIWFLKLSPLFTCEKQFSKIFQPSLGSIKKVNKNQTRSLVLTSHLLKLGKIRKYNSQTYRKQWLHQEITSLWKTSCPSRHR